MPVNTTFLTPIHVKPKITAQLHEYGLDFLESDDFVRLQLAAFPQYDEAVYLPHLTGFEEQTLQSLLPAADLANVSGMDGWRRSIVRGEYAGALWLTNDEVVLGVIWHKNTVKRTQLLKRKATEKGVVWVACLKEVEPRLPETEVLQFVDSDVKTVEAVDEPDEPVLPAEHSLCQADEPKAMIHIRVLAAYTKGAIEAIHRDPEWKSAGLDPLLHHRLLLQETANWTFLNSDLPVQATVRFLEIPDYRAPVDEAWEQLKQGTTPPFDEIHRQRELADVIALVGEFGGSGLAGDGEEPPTDGFLVVDWRDACLSFEFTHELGHILGADHQCEIEPNPGTCPFARAYCHEEYGRWSTVMARGCSGRRVPLWSSARGKFCHGDADRDNVRAIWGMAPKVAEYGENAAKKLQAPF